MNIGHYIKRLRQQKGLSQEELGKIIGVKRAAVQKWECGIVKNLKRTTIQKLADYFNVNPASFVIEDVDSLKVPTITDDIIIFPVIGNIAAGYDNIAVEDWTGETVEIPTSYLKGRNREDFFVLCVKGDSMFPEYRENDKVLILKQSTMEYSGQVGAVMYDDENATLKKIEYKYGEDWMRLVPINPNHQPKEFKDEALEHCRILGIPKYLVREIKQ